jgi:outer membrane protein OmpA-like peptidoglycan-associated protein
MGDVRLVPKLNLLNSGKGIQLAIASAVSLPTGDSQELQGEDGPTVEPRAILEFHFTDRLRGGVNAGYRMRKTGDYRGLPLGNEVTYGAGMAYDVSPERFTLIAESYGRAAADPDTRLAIDSVPLEATLGGRFKPGRGHSISVGTGPGVTEGYGSPTWRTYVAYAMTDIGPGDKDGDGISDNEDRCPTDPEDRDGFEDLDGCPDNDNDRDGLWDKVDRCPDNPEDPDSWEDDDGCPDPDNDSDRIADVVDSCPLKPEVYNGLEDGDGCPDDLPRVVETDNVKITEGKVVILQKIHFGMDKAAIKSISWEILDEVGEVLVSNPQLKRVRIEGHTDSVGGADYNLSLSTNRANAVRVYLVGRGVATERLEARGYGETVPVVANDGRHNKAINRRVEFTILEKAPAPVGAPAVQVQP